METQFLFSHFRIYSCLYTSLSLIYFQSYVSLVISYIFTIRVSILIYKNFAYLSLHVYNSTQYFKFMQISGLGT